MRPIALALFALAAVQALPAPQSIVDELLAADRRFAGEAARTTVIPALTAMMADDVVMPVTVPAPGFARGKASVIEALKTNPDNLQGRLAWVPARGGISADALHGFTFGYTTLTRANGSQAPGKYLAYWVKRDGAWRIAVYKRALTSQPPATREVMPPSLPARLLVPLTDPAALARHRDSLEAAERAFSDEAQAIGLGPAFAKWGHADAVNMGPPTSSTFVVSAAEIGTSIGAGAPAPTSPVRWAPDEGSIVASSGDLGVTFGFIRQNGPPPAGQPAAVPFVTIWRRAGADQPWRYIAE